MSLAIIGSRNFSNYEDLERAVLKVLEKWGLSLSDLEKIVSGGALGVDKLAEKFAKKYSIETVIFPADWKKGRAAGPIRNSLIVENCTHMIAFPSHTGSGTQDSIRKAEKKGIPLKVLWVN